MCYCSTDDEPMGQLFSWVIHAALYAQQRWWKLTRDLEHLMSVVLAYGKVAQSIRVRVRLRESRRIIQGMPPGLSGHALLEHLSQDEGKRKWPADVLGEHAVLGARDIQRRNSVRNCCRFPYFLLRCLSGLCIWSGMFDNSSYDLRLDGGQARPVIDLIHHSTSSYVNILLLGMLMNLALPQFGGGETLYNIRHWATVVWFRDAWVLTPNFSFFLAWAFNVSFHLLFPGHIGVGCLSSFCKRVTDINPFPSSLGKAISPEELKKQIRLSSLLASSN